MHKRNSFTFRIKEGSGYYQVKANDTEIAEVILRDYEIIVQPKYEGGLKITVEDVEVPDALPATAEILISDI